MKLPIANFNADRGLLFVLYSVRDQFVTLPLRINDRAGVKSKFRRLSSDMLTYFGSTPVPQNWSFSVPMDSFTVEQAPRIRNNVERPTRNQAKEAVRTLLAWAGDNPDREGLLDTPERVVSAYEEWFGGYEEDPYDYLSKTFDDVEGYDDMVMLKNIDIESHCEHHIAPIIGQAFVAYVPTHSVVGISKLARVVEIFSKRLQTQETMTAQICDAITQTLAPMGTAVLIDAKHHCMSTRGVHHTEVTTVTTQFTGLFKTDQDFRNRFLRLAGHQ